MFAYDPAEVRRVRTTRRTVRSRSRPLQFSAEIGSAASEEGEAVAEELRAEQQEDRHAARVVGGHVRTRTGGAPVRRPPTVAAPREAPGRLGPAGRVAHGLG